MSTTSEQRRLISDAESSTGIQYETGQEPNVEAHPHPSACQHPKISFFDGYEIIGGTPSRILKPSEEMSSFSCFAYSKDGYRLATGETNGTIRLWSSLKYSLLAEVTGLFAKQIESISFVLGSNCNLIAVDKGENLAEFSVEAADENGAENGGGREDTNIQVRRQMRLDPFIETDFDNPISTHQFSKNGRTLIHFLQGLDFKVDCPGWRDINVYRFSSDDYSKTTLTCDTTRCKVPILSGDGRRLLAITFPLVRGFPAEEKMHPGAAGVYVWPDLDSDPVAHHLDADRALWGLEGEYLILLGASGERQWTRVYRMSLSSHQPFSLLATRHFETGLSSWKAQMISHCSYGEVCVLIQTISKHGDRKFLIWDCSKNVLISEVLIQLRPGTPIDTSDWRLFDNSAEESIECDLFPEDSEAYYCLALEDSYPMFCSSKDGEWLAAFSWKSHSCSIASTGSGVTVWSVALPTELASNPFQLPNQCLCDPNGHHLMLFGGTGIVACAVSFLNNTADAPFRSYDFERQPFFYEISSGAHQDISAAFRTVPSGALAQTLMSRWSLSKTFLSFDQTWPMHEACAIRDASITTDWSALACISRGFTGESLVRVMDARESVTHSSQRGSRERNEIRVFADLRFPLELPEVDGEDEFEVGRVFLYVDTASSEKRMVVFSGGGRPMALFCNFSDDSWEFARFDMRACLRIQQLPDRGKILLLDEGAVCVLHLEQKRIIERIEYHVNFARLTTLVADATSWSHQKLFYRTEQSEQRISDDGKAVLLAWDIANRKSIIVDPTTAQAYCEELIRNANASLSEFCAVTPCGMGTLFVDVDDLVDGKITVGVFSEKDRTVTSRVCVAHAAQRRESQHEALTLLLTNVFYGLCRETGELIVVTAESKELTDHDWNVEDAVLVFNVHGTTGCVPTYKQLTSNPRLTIEESTKQCVERHGVHSLNAPFPSGLSLFEDALLCKNEEMIAYARSIVLKEKAELAVEWCSHEVPSSNCLEGPMERNSTNDIWEALRLIFSGLVPFRRVAVIMHGYFKALLIGQPEILEKAFSENLLIFKARDLNVHVDFLNTKLRRDTAVHIDTSETFLEWKHSGDAESLERNWRKKNESAIARMEQTGNASTTCASLHFVAIDDAAKVGMKGIIRPLLLLGAPEIIFKYDAVKWTVLYKWLKIWKNRFIRTAAVYAVFLAIFTAYLGIIGLSAHLSQESDFRKVTATCLVLLLSAFGLVMLLEDARQLTSLIKDGETYFDSVFWGLQYYFKSRWNWVDLTSGILLFVFIPAFHFLALYHRKYDEWLSIFVAVEAILAYIKVWYFAQPFRVTGALVLMIDNIFKDCVWFLGLASVVLCGFAMALHALFRSVEDENNDEDFLIESVNGTNTSFVGNGTNTGLVIHKSEDLVWEAFGTITKSLLTLFYAFLGTFDPEVYHSAGRLNPLTSFIFDIYMIAQMVVLLNLLIAIMGDTFDRVKSTEELQLLIGRAKFMDSCEASLNENECDELNATIGRYVHALVDKESGPSTETTAHWTGRLNMLEHTFRTLTNRSERNVKTTVQEMESKMEENFNQLRSEVEATNAANKETAERLERVISLLESRFGAGPPHPG